MTDYWIDTHAHIYSDEFKADRDDTLARSHEYGVGKIYMPNVDHTSIDGMMEVELKNPQQYISMMGLHPCSVKADFEKELYIVEEWLAKRKFAAVGEMGTDLYWDKTFWEQQKEAFVIQVNWAKKYKLPIVIHCRESINETIELLEPLIDDSLTGVFHCFSGNARQAERITKTGFYLGLGGVSTFKNSGMDKVIPELDLKNIVLETDCPYLAPVPHRGKRNEPSYIPLIAQKVSEFKKITINELKEITSSNAESLFQNKKPNQILNTIY
ncbi:MAG TPA: TatD family hydrolase [Cyclobacteriaceae bacterium]|jgi:TatD DNase family protein|nr:TatD family hydrolase [Cyclobacteriaceae bacterium]